MSTILNSLTAATLLALCAAPVAAHTPICACYDNGDGTALCEGGFSDGSSAAGVRMIVRDSKDNIVIDASMDETSEFVFDKPDGKFTVMFDAGEGHQIEITSDDIY